jgi:hypothetical protein
MGWKNVAAGLGTSATVNALKAAGAGQRTPI